MFQEQLQANIIEQVHDKGECGNVTYSPHKEVVKDQSATKKFRIVFDASARLIMIGKFWVYIFSIWVFFHEHSRITGLQGKEEGISLTPRYHFHPFTDT